MFSAPYRLIPLLLLFATSLAAQGTLDSVSRNLKRGQLLRVRLVAAGHILDGVDHALDVAHARRVGSVLREQLLRAAFEVRLVGREQFLRPPFRPGER